MEVLLECREAVLSSVPDAGYHTLARMVVGDRSVLHLPWEGGWLIPSALLSFFFFFPSLWRLKCQLVISVGGKGAARFPSLLECSPMAPPNMKEKS